MKCSYKYIIVYYNICDLNYRKQGTDFALELHNLFFFKVVKKKK